MRTTTTGSKFSVTLSSSLAALAISLGYSAPALAQQAEEISSSVQETGQAPESDSLGVIIVTARKFEENIQETPIAITALTGDELQARQIDSTVGLDRIAPNLVVSQGQGVSGNSSAGSYFVRGIGQLDFLLNTDPGVGLYVDGVYIARSIGSIIELIDLERVEVLRGPQGTLFGRNTIGGAISMVSRKPSRTFQGEAELTVGSFDRVDARVQVEGPLGDSIAAKLGVLYRDRDGWVDRITDGTTLGDEESIAIRGAISFEPSDRVTVDVIAEYLDSEGTSPPANVVQIVESAAFPSFVNGALVGPPCVPPPSPLDNPACLNSQYEADDLFEERGTFNSFQSTEVLGVSATINWEVSDGLTIKSITGYRDTSAVGNRDGDHTPFVIQNTSDTFEHEQFSQEIQFLGSLFDERVRYVLGGFYFSEKGENLSFIDFPVVSFQSGGSVDNENLAMFGQATWDITDQLAFTAGLRWTEETKTFLPDQFITRDVTGAFPPGSVPGFRLVPFTVSEIDISEVQPMFNISYDIVPELMVYATYSEGFKSGGFTQRIFPPLPAPPSFGPEFATSYEVGFKSTLAGGLVRFNGAGFYTDYADIQTIVFRGVQPLTENAGDAEIKGFELELEALPADGLNIRAAVGYLDARFTSLDPAVLVTGVNLDSEFPQVPEWSANFGISYEIENVGPGTLTPRVDLSWRDGVFLDAANTPAIFQPDYALLNASLNWESYSGSWLVSLFAQNITDQSYIVGGFADLTDQGYAEVQVGRPFEAGFSVMRRF
ncbi:TonB-dependent receptor [Erythrobacter sp. KY5]|uniref:TonB-dependent receptor n=1 Tax=Erythrobacter sp. KY5 TaxID=2011159 RepID=UPI0013A6A945|nr:TonB-dependent receptor [Erythrobacter sp. KY5]